MPERDALSALNYFQDTETVVYKPLCLQWIFTAAC